jgi:paired small multidrug resistance pump
MMKYGLLDFAGTVGVAIMVVAYLLLQLNRLDSNAPTYSLLNAFGASLVVLSLTVNFNFSAFIMEAFWVLISLIGLYRSLRTRTLKS